MDFPMGLTLEQQFKMKLYEEQVANMNKEQAQKLLLDVLRQMMLKENFFRNFTKSAL